jgi:hypothetical protein
MLVVSAHLSISKADILLRQISPHDIVGTTARVPGLPGVGMIEGFE